MVSTFSTRAAGLLAEAGFAAGGAMGVEVAPALAVGPLVSSESSLGSGVLHRGRAFSHFVYFGGNGLYGILPRNRSFVQRDSLNGVWI